MNARRTDSLAARLHALGMSAPTIEAGDLVNGLSILVGISGAETAHAVALSSHAAINDAIDLIELELAESESGKPKAARKKKRGAK